jgi:hypothetical protein
MILNIKNINSFSLKLKKFNFNESLFIPSYKQAVKMCNDNGELIFYETKLNIDGYNISLFNYRLAQYTISNNQLKIKIGMLMNLEDYVLSLIKMEAYIVVIFY